MDVENVLAWLGQMLLLVCSLPQAFKSYRDGHSAGLSVYMIWLWGLGMFFSFFYFLMTAQVPATINYGFNIFVWAIIAKYYHFPRKADFS